MKIKDFIKITDPKTEILIMEKRRIRTCDSVEDAFRNAFDFEPEYDCPYYNEDEGGCDNCKKTYDTDDEWDTWSGDSDYVPIKLSELTVCTVKVCERVDRKQTRRKPEKKPFLTLVVKEIEQ